MKKYRLHLDSSRCIACHGCEVHCKVNKRLPVGVLLCEISTTPLQKAGGIPRLDIHFTACRHCETPLCVPVCPKGAMIKRADGIVYIDEDSCIGCMACQNSCPWHIPIKNPVTGKAIKCDLCYNRIDAGLKPACAAKCATHALRLMRIKEV